METIDFILKVGNGKNTKLDKEYLAFVNNIISKQDEQENGRWEIYNMILKEFITINESILNEFKYRVTDNENPNEVILDIFEKYGKDDISAVTWNLKRRVEDYLDEDFFKRFC